MMRMVVAPSMSNLHSENQVDGEDRRMERMRVLW